MELPFCSSSLPEEKADKPAVTLRIRWDGRILAGEQLLFDPAGTEGRKVLRAWLSSQAGEMKKHPVEPSSSLAGLPAGLLLIKCDRTASFRHVLDLMKDCGRSETRIWRLNLASIYTGDGNAVLRGRLDISLPVGNTLTGSEKTEAYNPAAAPAVRPQEPARFRLSVVAAGKKLVSPGGKP
jgi:hypothetical protein